MNVVKDKKKNERRSKKGKGRRREQHNESRSGSQKESRTSNDASKCRNCCGAYPHKDSCPARNKKCTSCGKLNHFAKVCRTVPPDSVKRVTEEEGTDEDDYVYAVGEKKQPMCRLEIDGEYLEMMLDFGASVNLIDEVIYQRIYKGKAKNPRTSQTANFLLWITHTPTRARNNSGPDNCKIQQHISNPARC